MGEFGAFWALVKPFCLALGKDSIESTRQPIKMLDNTHICHMSCFISSLEIFVAILWHFHFIACFWLVPEHVAELLEFLLFPLLHACFGKSSSRPGLAGGNLR